MYRVGRTARAQVTCVGLEQSCCESPGWILRTQLMQIEGQLIPPTVTPFASQSWELIRLWLHHCALGWGSLAAVQSLGRT